MRSGFTDPTSGMIFVGCFSSHASASAVRVTLRSAAIASSAATTPSTRYPRCEGSKSLPPSPSNPPASGLHASGVRLSAWHWSSVPSVKAVRFARLISTWFAASGCSSFCWSSRWIMPTCEGEKLLTPNSRTLPDLCRLVKAMATSVASISQSGRWSW